MKVFWGYVHLVYALCGSATAAVVGILNLLLLAAAAQKCQWQIFVHDSVRR